jgi:hypothetical protein
MLNNTDTLFYHLNIEKSELMNMFTPDEQQYINNFLTKKKRKEKLLKISYI